MVNSTNSNADSISEAEQAVISGAIWEEFCDSLKETGKQILRQEAPADAFTRAEGWRYLTRLTRIALDMHMECADPDFPNFYRPSHETAKIGADNPDNYYERAQINGNYDYKITGKRGTVPYLQFMTMGGGYGEDGKNECTGSIATSFSSDTDFELEADGSFVVWVSSEKKAGNWLPANSRSNTLLVRQTFMDRSNEQKATISIERVDAAARPKPLRPETLANNLRSTAAFVQGTATLFADWSESYLPKPNELPPSDQALCQSVGGDPGIFYYHSYYDLAEDEALIVEFEHIPECDNWNLQVDNYWMESLDYRYHKIHVNKHTAQYNADGSCTVVIADSNPDHANWLELAGHRKGTLCACWIGARTEITHPKTRVVKLTELINE